MSKIFNLLSVFISRTHYNMAVKLESTGIESFKQQLKDFNKLENLVVYFSATKRDDGIPWCPDCAAGRLALWRYTCSIFLPFCFIKECFYNQNLRYYLNLATYTQRTAWGMVKYVNFYHRFWYVIIMGRLLVLTLGSLSDAIWCTQNIVISDMCTYTIITYLHATETFI